VFCEFSRPEKAASARPLTHPGPLRERLLPGAKLKLAEKKAMARLRVELGLMLEALGGGRAAGSGPSLAESHEGSEGLDLLLRTTFACNQRCPFCFVPLTGRPAPMKEIEGELKRQFQRAGPRGELTISGGEPASDPRLPRILAMARKLGFERFVLQTNAVYLARPGLLENLFESGVRTFLVSFHSREEAAYDRITGSRGQFARALTGLTRLLGADDCDVTVNIVVNAANFEDLPDLIDFLGDRCGRKPPAKPVGVYFSMINEAGHQKAPAWAIDLERAAPFLREASRRCRRRGLAVSKSGGESSFPVCVMGEPQRHAPSRTFPQDRVRYADDFTGQDGAIGRAKRPSCRECPYDAKCAGVPAAYAARFGLGALRVP
jgi:pyruvate-formate lyase-activating enzyme